ncbi:MULTISPECIES: hypothetical protein [unclassified Rhizobium]|uniref:hypothetical protein n=1 Tax=unclassified Rhizobium TaxID=2613769 RepID=UPI001ADA8434|nr:MULTISPECIES: hypothetical protein [unclassified Rhizobium]MBO9100831.1 hypothetical protein [Rhizobium sp. L58/93]MBO9170459.1 hypothetical protein [Rhizobium sp. L245/93]MBO9186384.1 hypothetical protein [Rhizobium sp. E27B/91]QXZ86295.1 hypothetical protein J5287_24880 [Rhizobium sp. K1/93]QXZ92250.1 hypothetical protein J5280_24305 [Rhizobium sp. K15/93]
MTRTEEVLERSAALVASLHIQRKRDLQRRADWQKRIELARPLPTAHLKSGGVQLALRLDS